MCKSWTWKAFKEIHELFYTVFMVHFASLYMVCGHALSFIAINQGDKTERHGLLFSCHSKYNLC